jgi:hypothetical protein
MFYKPKSQNGSTSVEVVLLIVVVISLFALIIMYALSEVGHSSKDDKSIPELESQLIGTLDGCKVYKVYPPTGSHPFYKQTCPNSAPELFNK